MELNNFNEDKDIDFNCKISVIMCRTVNRSLKNIRTKTKITLYKSYAYITACQRIPQS